MTETNDGAKSNYTQNYYDARGNVLRVYTGLSAPLTINGLDNVVPNGDENYAVTKYTYDIKGNLISTTDALGNTVSYDVDLANKRIKSTTDKNQNTFVFEYDAIGNVTSKSLADGTNAETTVYGLTGQVLSKTNDTSSIGYIYDNKGRLISETDSALGTVKTYTYDEAGNRLTFTLTRNGTTQMSQSYVYDKLNRLTSVSENGTIIATYTYDNKNNRTKTTVPNGETTNYSYNLANMLTSQTTGNKLNEQYTYYLNGNQKTKTSNGETTNYIYDGMNRLVRENNTSYTFDDFGNRLTMSDGTATTAYTYDLNNRLIASTETNNGAVKNTRYSYDYNGNQISKLVTSTKALEQGKGETVKISDKTDENVAFYEYNCYNQVIEADTNGVKSNYAYSPDGLRHSKTVGGNTITFVYDNANVVEEITQDGTNKYYRGFEIVKNDDNVYYLYNGQGDVAMLIDGTGKTVANYSFDAYGNQSEENTIYNPFGYRGEYQDNETGLIYLRARMYDPSIGRFISEDPIRSGTNWYVYCSNNPVNLIDPLGLFDYDDRLNPSTEYNIDVKVMQNELAWLGYYSGEIDGYFGQKTLDAVNAYKNAMGLGNTGSDWGVVGKQTWESMGLTYRTQADINAGVEISTVGLKQYKDFSVPINDALSDAAVVAEEKWRFNYKWFKSQVNHKKPWDIKRESPWNQTIGADTYPGWGVKVMYNNALMTPEELGNYTYGYIGVALGLTTAELYAGSWYAAGFPIGGDDWANEYNDWNSIKKGVNAYK